MDAIVTRLRDAELFGGTMVLADTLIKVTVILLLAWVVTTFLRRGSAALRHRIWCLTFAAVVVLPGLSYLLPKWRLPVLSDIAAEAAVQGHPAPGTTASADSGLAHRPIGGSITDLPTESALRAHDQGNAGGTHGGTMGSLAAERAAHLPTTSERNGAVGMESVTSSGNTREGRWLLVAMPAWSTGLLIVLVRLGVGTARVIRIHAAAKRITDVCWTKLCQDISHRLDVRRPVRLLEADRPMVPIVWGVFRPVVLLPPDARSWTDSLRRFVLVHELAHVKRWDVAFQMLGRLACALYWFHPLAWYALRRLRVERERACDDVVLMIGQRPSDYAQQLLEIAARFRPVGVHTAVAMARTTHLEGRVRALLDRARSHLPLKRRTARLLLISAALFVIALAVIRPSTRAAAHNEAPGQSQARQDANVQRTSSADGAPQSITGPHDDSATGQPNQEKQDDVELRYEGTVVDPEGNPMAGAKVFLVYWIHGVLPDYSAKPLAVTNNQGRFQFTVKTSDFGEDQHDWRYAAIVAAAKGFGFAHEMSAAFETTGYLAERFAFQMLLHWKERLTNPNRVLKLVTDDVPITGQVMTIDGQPVAGAWVRVEQVWWSPRGLDEWEKATKDEKADFYSLRTHTPEFLNGPQLRSIFPEAKSNSQGRFQLNGVGRERIAQLLIGGPGIETTQVKARTREGEKVVVPKQWPKQDFRPPDEIYFGASFTHVAGPSKPVVGRVSDADTGAPLPGVLVTAGQERVFSRHGKPFIATLTDADGRYRLDGLPVGGWNQIYAFPPSDTAYLPASSGWIGRRTDEAQIVLDFQLKRGVWVRGQAIDDRTGQPVAGVVQYYAFENNPHLQ